MHTLARPPVRETHLKNQACLRAFTLIELLTVIAIIAILASITFGVVTGVRERAAISRAKAELASLSLALESFKAQYGDYPQSGTSSQVENNNDVTQSTQAGRFFNALMGKLGPTGAPIDGRMFVDASRFSLISTTTLPMTGNTGSVDNGFLDPWGRLYVYAYTSGWTTYRLVTSGPNGELADTFGANGAVIPAPLANGDVDNIYSN
jgi:prepilin-type N-terminal cleavage/methylation domain-containing protein